MLKQWSNEGMSHYQSVRELDIFKCQDPREILSYQDQIELDGQTKKIENRIIDQSDLLILLSLLKYS